MDFIGGDEPRGGHGRPTEAARDAVREITIPHCPLDSLL